MAAIETIVDTMSIVRTDPFTANAFNTAWLTSSSGAGGLQPFPRSEIGRAHV